MEQHFWIKTIVRILYLVFITYFGYNIIIGTADFLSMLFTFFSLLGISMFMHVERKEVFKVLVAIYVSVAIIYYSYNNISFDLSMNGLLWLFLPFILIIFISSILYFIPNMILEYWHKRNMRLKSTRKIEKK